MAGKIDVAQCGLFAQLANHEMAQRLFK